MKNKIHSFIPSLLFVSSLFCHVIAGKGQEKAELWVRLDVSATHETYWLAGDPSTRVNTTSEIAFTHFGFYTFNRFIVDENYHYMVTPGRDASGLTPQTESLSVIQSHPCQDGQSLIIGRETRKIPSRIFPGSIGMKAMAAENGKVKLQFVPVEIDAEMLDCTNPDCVNGFGFEYGENIIGQNYTLQEEDEDGYMDVLGYDLITVDFKLLQELATNNKELSLTIPVSINHVYNDEEDTPTGPENKILTFRVTGWIGQINNDEE